MEAFFIDIIGALITGAIIGWVIKLCIPAIRDTWNEDQKK